MKICLTLFITFFIIYINISNVVNSAPIIKKRVVDPVQTIDCLTQSVGDVTSLVDPSAPGIPAELPVVGCLDP